jgi:hypothetical protein
VQVPTTDERVKLSDEWTSLAKHDLGGRALLWDAAMLGVRADQCGDLYSNSVVIGTGFAKVPRVSATGLCEPGGLFENTS